jgi:Sperm-tail PG-rich repeat
MSYTSKKGTFGSSSQKRFKPADSDTPGVGNYDLNGHTIMNWLMNSKIRIPQTQQVKTESNSNNNPGPGEYAPEIKSSKRMGPSYTIGRGKRPQLTNIDPSVPGPGKYIAVYKDDSTNDTNFRSTMRETFGKSKRGEMALDTCTPGPHYDVIGRTNSAPKFSFKGKKGDKLNREDVRFPGPGAYYTSHNFMIGKGTPTHLIGT